jgi:hypothetical protein
MKTNCKCVILLLLAAIICDSYTAFSQKNKPKPLDSALEANSEKWKVNLHKGFGTGKPEFGPYATSNVEKTDSAAFKKRTKTGSSYGMGMGSESLLYWDFSKYETVEKSKAFTAIVATETDTAQLLFLIYRISKEKNLTFLGEMMNGSSSGTTLESKTNISCIMTTSYDTVAWRFLLEDTFNRGGHTLPSGITRTTFGYLVTETDSLYAEPIVSNYGSPGDKYFWQSQKGVFINNETGDHLAALKFGEQGNLSNPFLVWIRKETEPAKQHVIASFFALMMIAKMYSQTN